MKRMHKITTMDMQPDMMVVDSECGGLYRCVSRQEDGVTLELVAGEADAFEPDDSGPYTFSHSEVVWVEVPTSLVEKMKSFFLWVPYLKRYFKKGGPIFGGLTYCIPDVELWSKVNEWERQAAQFAKSFSHREYSSAQARDQFGDLVAKQQEIEKELEKCYQNHFLTIVQEWSRLELKIR